MRRRSRAARHESREPRLAPLRVLVHRLRPLGRRFELRCRRLLPIQQRRNKPERPGGCRRRLLGRRAVRRGRRGRRVSRVQLCIRESERGVRGAGCSARGLLPPRVRLEGGQLRHRGRDARLGGGERGELRRK